MPLPSPELQSKIAILRQKALAGDLTSDDVREAIELLRSDRRGAAVASATSKTKAAKVAIPSAADMLSELEGL